MKKTKRSTERDLIQENLLREKKAADKRKAAEPPGDACKVYGDPLVAYCVDTREYLGLKRVIEFTQKHPDYQLKSLAEMKEMMKDLIEDSVNQLKKREEIIEQANIEQRPSENKEKMDGLRARGLQQMGVMKERVFEYVRSFFQELENQWHSMFEHVNHTQKKKNEVMQEVQGHIRDFVDLKEHYVRNIEGNALATFKELHELTAKISENPFIMKNLDERIGSLIGDIGRVSHVSITPRLTFNEKLIVNMKDALSSFAHISMTSEKDSSDKYGYSSLRVTTSDFYENDGLRKNINSNLATVCNITNNKYLPVIAKNRKLLMYEITTSSLKEFPINEVFHIPLQNQLIISKLNPSVVYISGGHLYKAGCDKFFEFNFKTSRFAPLQNMRNARWLHRLEQYGNWIFATGGVTTMKEIPTGVCERFNINSGKWEDMQPMKFPRHSHALCYHELPEIGNTNAKTPVLFAVGGIGKGKSFVESIEIYDIIMNNWREVTLKNPIHSPKSAGLFCTSINPTQLLIFGGFKHLAFSRGNAEVAETSSNKNSKSNSGILFDYPYANSKVWVYNINEESTRLLDSHHLGYGIFNEGNQIIPEGRALYCIGKFNEKVAHVPTNQLLFSEDENNKMAALQIDSNDFAFKDFILLT